MPLRGRLGRRHFDTQKQIDMIQGHGTMVSVFPCVPCPCLLEEGHYDPNCIACGGNGRLYPPDRHYVTTMALVQESTQLLYLGTGTWGSGIVHASILPDIDLAENDQVRCLDKKTVFREVLQKDVRDTLRFVSGIEIVFIVDRTTTYFPDRDYVLTAPNLITWVPGGHAPLFSQHYSVRYQAYPDYLVSGDDPRWRVEGRRPQSSEVILMRLDMIAHE